MTVTSLTSLPMTLTQAAQKYGQARESLNVGDIVMCEASNSSVGSYLILAEVIEVSLAIARLRSVNAYHFSGRVEPAAEYLEAPITYFRDSIGVRLQKNNDFFRWLSAQLGT